MTYPPPAVNSEEQSPQPVRRTWPWVLGTIAGLVAGGVTWFVTGFFAWFEAGGTFGGLGASASDNVDWGRLQELSAWSIAISVLVAGVVPLIWAWGARRRAGEADRRTKTITFAAVAAGILALAFSPYVRLQVDRARAIEPDSEVVAAFRSSVDGPLERLLERRHEYRPWMVIYRTESSVDFDEVVAGTSASGVWFCSDRHDDIRAYRTSSGASLLARSGEGEVELLPIFDQEYDWLSVEHCT